MDLVGSCKDKLAYFRIKELKDILTQLGLSKQGKKQDLVDRILGVLSDEQVSKAWAKKNSIRKEEVAKLVDDTYRKMQVSGATDLASKAQGGSDCSNSKINGEIDDSKVRCPCGSSSLGTESVIKCEDPRCRVWQHIGCVIIPEKSTEGNPQVPDVFYCEICRLSRADPFWVTIAHPLYPVKLATTSVPTDGSSPMQGVEKTFHLTRADKDLLTKQEYDVQAWCMLLNDKVPFRMHWPQFADLQVNGVPVRAINRPGSQLLGTNGRDDGPIITPCTKDGINKISLTGCDARIFCLGVRIVKRRTVQQILNLIPKESNGESFEEALARVCRCVGGTPTDNADSDSDIEVVAESITVNLRCPMSGSRMKVAGRFKPCGHMGGFDLDVFVELNQRSRKWQCPICLNNHSLESVIIDPYFNRITTKMRHCGEDVSEVEVKPNGSWRVKAKTEAERREIGELAQWHYPDGNLCAPNSEHESKMEAVKQIKQEGSSEGHTGTCLKIGIRKNRNGLWEVSKPEGASSGRLLENFENHEQKVIPMSSSATVSGRDGEDRSVNQGGGGNFDFSNTGMELESIPLNAFPTYGLADQNFSAPVGDADVIVLSDSDDDTDVLIPGETVYKNNQTDDGEPAYSAPLPIITDPYPQDHTLSASGTSCLGLFNPNEEDYSIDIWSMGSQGVPGFQLFSSDVSDSLVDMQQGPTNSNCQLPMNGFAFPSDTVMGTNGILPDSFVDRSETDINNGLVDNPLAFGGEDPALQIFLPTRPSDATVLSDLRVRDDVSNGVRTDDWISLRLGGGITATHGDSATNVLNSRHQMSPREGALDSFTGNDPLHLGSNARSEKGSRQRSDRPFSFPRQKRSVKPKLYLSIDSDTSE